MKVIGITGGVGAGKSTVVGILQKHYTTEYLHCDVIAHEVMEPGGSAHEELLRLFGKDIVNEVIEQFVIDDAITLKRYYKEANRVKLQPENPDFQAIYCQDVRIVGILSSIVRTY